MSALDLGRKTTLSRIDPDPVRGHGHAGVVDVNAMSEHCEDVRGLIMAHRVRQQQQQQQQQQQSKRPDRKQKQQQTKQPDQNQQRKKKQDWHAKPSPSGPPTASNTDINPVTDSAANKRRRLHRDPDAK